MREFKFFLSAALLTLMWSCNVGVVDVDTVVEGDFTYHGQLKDGVRNGYGVLSSREGKVVYSGQWKDGKRCGYGSATDSLGRLVTALWNADTIVSGMRTDSLGSYHGGFDAGLRASGHGTWKGRHGSFYTGEWTADERNGLGCGVDINGKVNSGDWRKGTFRGERMLHTSGRIYGIDLARYQHEKGKKKFAIDWDKLRIVGLGPEEKQRSRGVVDYPVTFAYIKSTEGTTVKNSYFRQDYLQARQHGIHVGAYHFFSTKSAASQQAAFFLKNTIFRPGDLPPVLDVEPSDAQIREMGGAEEMFRRIRVWMNAVARATGVKPVLYVGQGFVNKYLPMAPDITNSFPIWIARYGQYRPDITLAFWQLTPYGKVRGIHGEVDINVFNGYDEQFREFMQRQAIK